MASHGGKTWQDYAELHCHYFQVSRPERAEDQPPTGRTQRWTTSASETGRLSLTSCVTTLWPSAANEDRHTVVSMRYSLSRRDSHSSPKLYHACIRALDNPANWRRTSTRKPFARFLAVAQSYDPDHNRKRGLFEGWSFLSSSELQDVVISRFSTLVTFDTWIEGSMEWPRTGRTPLNDFIDRSLA